LLVVNLISITNSTAVVLVRRGWAPRENHYERATQY